MKNLLLLLLLVFSSFGYSQSLPDGWSISAVRRDDPSQSLVPKGVAIKYETPTTPTGGEYELYFVEYIKGVENKDDFSCLFGTQISDKSVRYETTPDVSRKGHFILFSAFYSGMVSLSHRFSTENENFSYSQFEKSNKSPVNTKVPLLLVAENSSMDKILSFLKRGKDEKLKLNDFKKIISPQSPVEKISILYYIVKK